MIFQNEDKKPRGVSFILSPLSFIVGEGQSLYFNFRYDLVSTLSLYLNLVGISENNRVLRAENERLKSKVQLFEELKKENDRLNRLLGFQKQEPIKLAAAKVIGTDLIPNRETLIINKGFEHGIKVFMPVVVPSGVVGYIFRIQAHSSQVLLLTDSYAVVDALVQRSRTRLLVEGHNLKTLTSTYFKEDPDIRENDLIVASGLDNILPKGFPIGTVISVHKDVYSATPSVSIKPRVPLNRLEEVFVVLNLAHKKGSL